MTYENDYKKGEDRMDKFKAIVVRKENDEVTQALEEVTLDNLSDGDVVVEVEYSSVNYKDMLAFQPKGGIIRNYPMIPGIDMAGTVVSSKTDEFKEGDAVLINSTDPGVKTTGGFAEYARTEARNVTKLPANLSARDAMLYGTAGFTSALSVQALEEHGMAPENDPDILVTGATGGVGSVAIQILKKAGYKNIHALVRKDYQVEVAKKLGATNIVFADDLTSGRNTLDERNYHYVIDTVGGDVAAKALAQIHENGSMAMSGNAGGHKLEATVFPIILRGVNILGINSVDYPKEAKNALWEKLANEWNVTDELVSQEVALSDLEETIEAIKEGKHLGRTVVKVKE